MFPRKESVDLNEDTFYSVNTRVADGWEYSQTSIQVIFNQDQT